MMSFLGAIGNIMRGSGIEDIFGLIYSSNTIEHILSSKACACAVRGHFIIHATLTDLLIYFLSNPLTDDDDNCSVAVDSDAVCAMAGIMPKSAMECIQNLYVRTFNDGVCADNTDILLDANLL